MITFQKNSTPLPVFPAYEAQTSPMFLQLRRFLQLSQVAPCLSSAQSFTYIASCFFFLALKRLMAVPLIPALVCYQYKLL
jgi:hypothetical protein